ncbi:hypothetical protein MRX96_048874 [Rhipicephalus microplus]
MSVDGKKEGGVHRAGVKCVWCDFTNTSRAGVLLRTAAAVDLLSRVAATPTSLSSASGSCATEEEASATDTVWCSTSSSPTSMADDNVVFDDVYEMHEFIGK